MTLKQLPLFFVLFSVVWGLEKCDEVVPCHQRDPGCSSCTAPASFSSGVSCKRPHHFLKPLLEPWCFYCAATNKCMDHKKSSKSECAQASAGFVKFEDQCVGVFADEEDDYVPNEFLSNWMGKLMEVGGSQRTLLDLSLLGSHDSLSYDLSLEMGELADSDFSFVDEIIKLAGKFIPGVEARAAAFARRAAVTQYLTISQQLDSGVRFIDLRIGYESEFSEWYSLHTLRTNNPVQKYLDNIKEWMIKHPTEIIVVWISRHGENDQIGDDQFPGVTLEQKQQFWLQYTTTFGGMLVDFTESPIHTTPLKDIAGKIVTYATDYIELTDSSPFALDSPQFLVNSIQGHLIAGEMPDGTSAVTANYLYEQKEFAEAISRKKSNPDQFYVLSMASSMDAHLLEATSSIALNPFPSMKDKGQQMCDDYYKIPGFGGWCPMSLFGNGLLANYYKQITLEQTRVNNAWDYPHAIYIDAIDFDGTVRTSDELPWESGHSQYPQDIRRYGIAWAIIGRNILVMCEDASQEEKSRCKELAHTAELGIRKYPEKRWDHPLKGRVTKWPESHSDDNDVSSKEATPASFATNSIDTVSI